MIFFLVLPETSTDVINPLKSGIVNIGLNIFSKKNSDMNVLRSNVVILGNRFSTNTAMILHIHLIE